MTRRMGRRTIWKVWLGVVGLAMLPVLLATLPPFLEPEARVAVMQAFAPFCHQMPSRSPHLMGVQLAVGHRTYGLLAALPFGSLSVLFLHRWSGILHRHMPRILLAAALPMAVDWILGTSGLWANVPLSRGLTGGLFGLTIGYYVTQGVVPLETAPTGESSKGESSNGKPSKGESTRERLLHS